MKRLTIFVLLSGSLFLQRGAAQGVITTVAGADFAFPLNVTLAKDAPLGQVYSIAVDGAGNIYVADYGNNRVFRVGQDGSIRTVAGNGLLGFSGDGGPATAASLRGPNGVAVDTAGNVFFSDYNNQRIRKVSPNGIITTVAGNGLYGYDGDGSPATAYALYDPGGLALDKLGNLFIADTGNNLIRKVSPSGVISTVAGDGFNDFFGDGGPATQASLNGPYSVAVDTLGNLYIADQNNNRIRKVSASNGIITTVAGNGAYAYSGDGGLGTKAALYGPEGVTVDAAFNLFITDTYNNRIRKLSAAGIITTVAGNGNAGSQGDGGLATSAYLKLPSSTALDTAGNLYIADLGSFAIRKVSATSGVISAVAGNRGFLFSGDGGPAAAAALFRPTGVALDSSGNIFIPVRGDRIRKVDRLSGVITTIAGNGIGAFSGDGGLATAASINSPSGILVDKGGNLIFTDYFNNRVRKVTPSGIISTVAGNGTEGYSGDGGLATSAALSSPEGLAMDAPGNLIIADFGNYRVRKVTPGGVITTVAGNGNFAFTGDGGPATAASLAGPTAVAVDAAGNMYIVDQSNNRIRRVSAGGIISTVAGTGDAGYSGDGGPATAAKLKAPQGIAIDSAGNLLIADADNNCVRKISNGVITTIAGTGAYGFSGDGGPATAATLGQPFGMTQDASGNLYIADYGNNRIRSIRAAAPTMSVGPAKLTFSQTAGVQQSPAQQINISGTLPGLPWTATASDPWIVLATASGSSPASVDVTANTFSLQPAKYTGTITIKSSLAVIPKPSVSVELTVTAANPAKLAVEPFTLNFGALAGSSPQPQVLHVTNSGGGSLSWTAQPDAGTSWLTLSPQSGSVAAGAVSTITVTPSTAALSAGAYASGISITSSTTGETRPVVVNLLLDPPKTTILLSQSGMTFTGIQGGAVVPSQTFGVLNTGQGTMPWTATKAAGGSWLTLSTSSGSSVANSANIPLTDVAADTTGMNPGQYSAQIRIDAPGATNTPQLVTVTLNVLPRGSPLPPIVRPTGLIFVRQTGTSSPGSQTITLSTALPGTIEAVPNPFDLKRLNWLTTYPGNLTFAPGKGNVITVQPVLGKLAAGEYRGFIPIGFTDGSSQTVNVLFVVTAGPTTSANSDDSGAFPGVAAVVCTPQKLYLAVRTLSNSFASSAGFPQTIQAEVRDDCSNTVSNATTIATFSNGDPALGLVSVGNGLYEASWTPANSSAQVSVLVRAQSGTLSPAEGSVSGQVSANAQLSAIASGGVVNAASFAGGAALAPGSIIAIFGSNLARAPAGVGGFPIPTSLGSLRLNFGGRDVPLFYVSPNQVNAQIPLDVPINFRPQAYIAVANGAVESLTVPETVTVARARPGIFTAGGGQGVIVDPAGPLLDASYPATPGQVVVIYATGLGAVDQLIVTGQPAPGNPLARVTTPLQVTIGGLPATIGFAGLTPGLVGLYQLNVTVPAAVTPGNAVPVVILQDGVTSNTVTMAVKRP